MDKLEKYINDNREEFDDRSAPSYMYDNIQSQVSGTPKKNRNTPIWLMSKVAAAFAVVLAAGVVIGFYLNDRGGDRYMEDKVFRDYIDVEKQYVKDINYKMNALKAHDLDPQIDADIMQLDEVYAELKKELHKGNNVNNDKIIEALIMNYEVKVDMLEKVLSKVKSAEENIEINKLRDDTINI